LARNTFFAASEARGG